LAPFGVHGYNGCVKGVAVLAVVLGAVFATNAVAAPRPHVERAQTGQVQAVFSYSWDPAKFRFSRQHIAITRDGTTRFSAYLRRPPVSSGTANAQPAGFFSHKRSVSLTDLDGDGDPEVVLDLYWGGAHCCWYTQIYRYDAATQHYRPLVHVWGNVNYVLADLDHDGRQELVTRDDRFSYAFSDFADSRWPVRILAFRAGKLTVVTTSYAAEIKRDSASLWHEAMARGRKQSSNQGMMAAWAADQCMLRRCAIAFRSIASLSKTGRVHGELPAARYERKLRAFLKRTDYL
jgi:hypothetical protein